ncbi:MAG: alkaline phosphatase family protein [Candidatus Hydrothermarchaeaceae archaeon]
MGRVLVIGLDGATFDVMGPLVKEGKLPVIAGLMGKGTSGHLKSTIPFVTAPAWASFMTGKSPGKHGVFGFLDRKKNSYERVLVDGSAIRAKTLWEILSDYGKKSIVVNVPMTYPPRKINGVLISGMGAPASGEFCYPASARRELGDYRVDMDIPYRPGREEEFLRDLDDLTEKRKIAVLDLLKRDWDFFMCVFVGLDRVQHHFWKFTDPENPAYDEDMAHRFGSTISDYYQKMDGIIGEMIESAGDATVALMSDHGFGQVHKVFNASNFLAGLGLLKRGREDLMRFTSKDFKFETRRNTTVKREDDCVSISVPDRDNFAGVKVTLKGLDVFKEYRISAIARSSPEGLLLEFNKNNEILGSSGVGRDFERHSAILKPDASKETFAIRLTTYNNPPGTLFIKEVEVSEHVDWSGTRAYSGSTCGSLADRGIYVNLKGVEPGGIVESGQEYEELRDLIIRELLNVEDPGTGERIVSHAYKREDLYEGPYLDRAADITFLVEDNRYILFETVDVGKGPEANQLVSTTERFSGSHRLNGIFVMAGEGIKENNRIKDAEIIDIAPTILHLMDLPVPSDMDGKVLTETFTEAKEVGYKDPGSGAYESAGAGEISREDEEKIKERLRGLGYIK